MKVYVIEAGNTHEGGGIGDTAFKDYHTARMEAEELVDAKQQEDDECYDWDYEMSPPVTKWTEWREDYWTNDIEYVQIKELKVI